MNNDIKYFAPSETVQSMEIKLADRYISLVKQGKNPFTMQPLMPNMDFVTNRTFTGFNDISLLFAATEQGVKSLAGTFGANIEICGITLNENVHPTPLYANFNNTNTNDLVNVQNRSNMLHEGAKIDGQLFYFFDDISDKSKGRLSEKYVNSTKSYIEMRGDEATRKYSALLAKKIVTNIANYNHIHDNPSFQKKLNYYTENMDNEIIRNVMMKEKLKIINSLKIKEVKKSDVEINKAIQTLFYAVTEYKKCQLTNKKSKFLIEHKDDIDASTEFLIKNIEEGRIKKNIFTRIIAQGNQYADRQMTKDFSYNYQHEIAQNQKVAQTQEKELVMALPEKEINRARNNPQKWERGTR